MQSYNPGVLGWGFLRLLLRLQLRSLSKGVPSSHLEKDERLILGHICIYSWKRHALCYAVFGFARNRWLNTLYGIVWETKYGRFTTLNIPKCEHFTLLVCPLRFLVISAMRRLGNVQSFKTYMFRFRTFCHERDPGEAGYPALRCLHGKLSPRLTGLPYLDIDIAHRTLTRNATPGPRPVVCKFTWRISTEKVKNVRKDACKVTAIGLPADCTLKNAQLFDNITPQVQQLLVDTKKFQTCDGFRFLWC